MNDFLAALARLLRVVLDAVEAGQRRERLADHEATHAAIEADPVSWFVRHFGGMPDTLPADAREASETNDQRADRIVIDRLGVERLSKYIVDLERGYE